ncbi:MAG: aminotransferase class I/II-fold pyridoxal phosphate-dependent enzyme, partial [Deltaproteobacteria bacterium]
MSFGHGGHIRNLARLAGCKAEELLDFSANINPLGPPDSVRQAIAGNLSAAVLHYPDPQCLEFCEVIASRFSAPLEQVIVGNGSTEILNVLPRVLGVDRAVIPAPSYTDYAAAATKAGLDVEYLLMNESDGFAVDWSRVEDALLGQEIVIVGQPGNPCGSTFGPVGLLAVADRHPSTFFIVDEAFADFIEGY